MKRTPKSFDASMKQAPKQLVLGMELGDELDIIDEEFDNSSRIGEELSATLNRLQVSSSITNSASQDDNATLGSSQNSDRTLQDLLSSESSVPTKKKRKSSKKKSKRFEDTELLASLNNNGPSLQEEEERTFSRCLDGGIRSAHLSGFFFARDEDQKQFTVFRIEVVTVAQSWIIYRRYSDFMNLSAKLQNLSPANFPPKTPFGGNFAKDFLYKRQASLSLWLEKALMTPGVVTMSDVRQFLVVGANCVPASLVGDEHKKSSTSSAGSAQLDLQRKPSTEIVVEKPKQEEAPITPKKEISAPAASTPPNMDIDYNETSPTESTQQKSPYCHNPRKVNLGDFEQLQVLGQGSFGKVVLVTKRTGKDANTMYAMKILNKQNVVKKKQVEHTLTERSVLGKMNHPFIVKLHYAFQTENKLHFVLDYCPGGELFFHLGRAGRFSEEQGRFYAAEMTLALGHLHTHGVVYRDLKPENILFEANGHLKLADFGLSKEGVESTQGSHSFCGTPEYLAPEILSRTGHGTAVDWWSLGALLYEMLTGLPPWFSQDRQKMFSGILEAPLRFPPEISPLARSVLSDFLKRDPLKRLGSGGVEQVKQHPFFAAIDWVELYELKLPAPFVPNVTGATDTGNFDEQFTRLPLNSEACSPMHVMSSASPLSTATLQAQLQAQKKVHAGDDLFGGFTYQEDHGIATPPTVFPGFCTPPALPLNKRTSPLRPGPNVFHPRPPTLSGSGARTPTSFMPASSPPVSG